MTVTPIEVPDWGVAIAIVIGIACIIALATSRKWWG